MSTPDAPWTVQRLLEWTIPFFARKNLDSPRLRAEMLLSHVLQLPRIQLYTNYNRPVNPEPLAQFRDLVRRAAEEEPVPYLTGKAHFFNLEFDVTPDVLIPRPDTETLVENVIRVVRSEPGLVSALPAAPRILDLCTGSGCIAAALATQVPTSIVLATDISPQAVAVARRNVERLGLAGRVQIEAGDLLGPVSKSADPHPFHILVANPPYIATEVWKTLPKNVRDFEPKSALEAGADGLHFIRRILAESPAHLLPNAHIFIEIAYDQGPAALALVAEQGGHFSDARILKDYAQNPRVLTARRS